MYDYYHQPFLVKRDVAVAAGCDLTVLSALRNDVSLDLGLLLVIVLPWSVSGASSIIIINGFKPPGWLHK